MEKKGSLIARRICGFEMCSNYKTQFLVEFVNNEQRWLSIREMVPLLTPRMLKEFRERQECALKANMHSYFDNFAVEDSSVGRCDENKKAQHGMDCKEKSIDHWFEFFIGPKCNFMDELEEKMLDMLVPPGPKFKKLKWMQEREQMTNNKKRAADWSISDCETSVTAIEKCSGNSVLKKGRIEPACDGQGDIASTTVSAAKRDTKEIRNMDCLSSIDKIEKAM